jgi:hypothetical protein
MMTEKVEVALGVFQSVCLMIGNAEKGSVSIEGDLAVLNDAAIRVLKQVLQRPDVDEKISAMLEKVTEQQKKHLEHQTELNEWLKQNPTYRKKPDPGLQSAREEVMKVVKAKKKKDKDKDKLTKQDVLNMRELSKSGCCDRYADNMGCECLQNAIED